MDLLVTILFILCIGTIKVIKNLKLDSVPILEADGTLHVTGEERLIGNNFMLKKELEAFTYILKELKLKK